MASLGSTIIYGDLQVTGEVKGGSNIATKFKTPRNINGVAFDGTANITIADDTKLPLSGGTMTGDLQMAARKISFSTATPDICIVNTSDRISFGSSAARGVNVGSLLVSNAWADATKVPVNGMYVKGNIVTDGSVTSVTAPVGTNTTQLATTAYVNAEIANDAAPIAHVGATGAAHGVVTTSVAGFMSAADKTKLDGIAAGAQVNAVNSVAGKTGVVTLVKADVGLGNVDNTSDANKPVSTATQTALDNKAPVSHTHDASAIVSGTIADARLPGRLREVAASITDWNDAQANGWYMAADAANAPISGTWFIGSVENHGVYGWCTQVVHAFSTDFEHDTKTYRRERNNGTWGTWQRCRITEAEQAVVTQAWWDSTTIPIDKVTGLHAALNAISGTNTGDETAATIKSKLGITTLSGVNTGDQTTITGNAGSATKLQTARTIGGVSFDGAANINLPGVNAPGNQNTSGTAERANGLNKTLVINGTNFNGVNDVNVSVGFLNIPLVSASANTLITKTHAGGGLKHPASDTTARTFTVDSNANQNWGDGTTIAIWNVNGTGGVITIAVVTDTMRLADDGTTGSRSLRRNGFAILVWDTESLSWIISGPGVS